MTITYNSLIHSGKGGAGRLMFCWRGSMFKSLYQSFFWYMVAYFAIAIIYRYGLTQDEVIQAQFERFCSYCLEKKEMINLAFLLGFFTSQVVAAWWNQLQYIAWIDQVAMYCAVYLPGKENELLRRTIVRWANLCNVIVLMGVSQKVADRFPTYEHLVEAKLLTLEEMAKIREIHTTVDTKHHLTYLPIAWAQAAVRKASEENKLSKKQAIELIRALQSLCSTNGNLIIYGNWVPIPLAYTQVVVVATYTYFLVALVANQYLVPVLYLPDASAPNGLRKLDMANLTNELRYKAVNTVGYDHLQPDCVVPIFLILEFLFYYGWFKNAIDLICPFGNDDDDFDVNYVTDRNVLIGHLQIDSEGFDKRMMDDPFEGKQAPLELPHSEDSRPDGAFKRDKTMAQRLKPRRRVRKEQAPNFGHHYAYPPATTPNNPENHGKKDPQGLDNMGMDSRMV